MKYSYIKTLFVLKSDEDVIQFITDKLLFIKMEMFGLILRFVMKLVKLLTWLRYLVRIFLMTEFNPFRYW